MCEKIRRGEYVDFARLLPKERVSTDKTKLELVNRGGQTFFVPARETPGITNFGKLRASF